MRHQVYCCQQTNLTTAQLGDDQDRWQDREGKTGSQSIVKLSAKSRDGSDLIDRRGSCEEMRAVIPSSTPGLDDGYDENEKAGKRRRRLIEHTCEDEGEKI